MPVDVGGGDRDQRDAEIADLLEHAVQRGLVGDGAGQDGRPVGGVADLQAIEAGGPAGVQTSDKADLVGPWGLVVSVHGAPFEVLDSGSSPSGGS